MATSPNPDLIAFIDVETDGLDERVNNLLEISAIVTDNAFRPVDDGISVVIEPDLPGWRDDLDPFVERMHSANGLLDEIALGASVSVGTADRRVAAYLDRHRGGRPLILGGNSITLDRNFLRESAPATFARLHYRSLDVSSVRNFCERVLGLPKAGVSAAGAHRGLSDLRDTLALACALREQVRGLGGVEVRGEHGGLV